MPLEMTAEMVQTIIVSTGGFIAVVIGAFTAFYKVQAKAANEDRKQVQELIQAIVTVPAANGDSGPTNGRTKLLVEQTHGISERMERSFSDIAKATAAQTEMIRGHGQELKEMNLDNRERLDLFREWGDGQSKIMEMLGRTHVCPRAVEEYEESKGGHDI